MKKLNIIIVFLLLFSIKVNAQYVLPGGGKNLKEWQHNNTVNISWVSGFVIDSLNTKVKIELWNANNNQTIQIATNIEDSLGNYQWTIPDTITIGNKYKVRIINKDSTQYNMICDDYIEISEEPSPILTIENNKVENTINLFPNPNNGIFTLNSQSMIMEIKVVDLLGKVYYEERNLNLNSFNFNQSNLTKGSYILIIKTKELTNESLRFTVE